MNVHPVLVDRREAHNILLDRLLPVNGRVLVQVGDRLRAEDAVASATVPSLPTIVPVAAALGIPVTAVPRYLGKAPGDTVEAGEVVASRRGLIGGRELTAPVSGRIIAIESGCVVIQAEPDVHTLAALVPGVVSSVMPNRGVRLLTRGLTFRGLGCLGGEQAGRLVLWDPQAQTSSDPIVTIVSHLDQATAQRMAGTVRGVVAGAVTADALAWLHTQRAALGPLLALNGVRGTPPPASAWRPLLDLVGRNGALIVADPAGSPGALSLLIVPQGTVRPGGAEPVETLEVGDRVRPLVGPAAGTIGVVIALPTQPERLESSHTAQVAIVQYGESRRAEPLLNLVRVIDADG